MCWLILCDKTSSSLPVWKTYLLPTIMRKENLHHLKVEDMAWILKSTMPHSTPKWKISHFTTYYRSIVVCITTRIEKSLIFWEKFKDKSQSGKMVWNEIDWLLVFSQKKVKVLLNWLKFIYENVSKMHGPKSKFIMKMFQVSKQEEFFLEEGEDFWN